MAELITTLFLFGAVAVCAVFFYRTLLGDEE